MAKVRIKLKKPKIWKQNGVWYCAMSKKSKVYLKSHDVKLLCSVLEANIYNIK
jgi:hypothetical protein